MQRITRVKSRLSGLSGAIALAALLVAGCRNPVTPLDAVGSSTAQSVISGTPELCRTVTVNTTYAYGGTISAWWPPAVTTKCDGGLKVIPGAPAQLLEVENGKMLVRLIVRYVNLTGVPLRRPLDIMLPPEGKLVYNGSTLMNPNQGLPEGYDSLGAQNRTWWSLAGPTGVLGVGDTSRADTLHFRLGALVTRVILKFQHLPQTVTSPVPPEAPDTLPAWTLNDSSYVGLRLKRVLNITFDSAATLVDRQAVIASVGGQVIGGVRSVGPEGDYYVLVPGNPSSETIDSLAAVLEAHPRVAIASATSRGLSPMVRLPDDGLGWKRGDWALSPDSAGGSNWAAEEIAAPLAWSCGTGDPSVRITVIDYIFDQTEVASNAVAPLPVFGSLPANTQRHGTKVAGLIASPGGNDTGLAGVMWKASLQLDDVGPAIRAGRLTGTELASRIVRAGQAGSRIVNVSWGAQSLTTSRGDSALIRGDLRRLKKLLNRLSPAQFPLLVIAAGNSNDDAWVAELPALKDEFPDNVIVVGGSAPGTPRNRWGGASFVRHVDNGSNHGRLLDVYAPAVDVAVPVLVGGVETLVTTISGTSLAAPLVTGIAGLLLSLDPSLTPAQLRQMIIQGAALGGRGLASDPGRYVVNAWESLKLASNKPGTPVCGKRVRTDVAQGQEVIVIDRTPSFVEILHPSNDLTGMILMVSVAPGGRKISTIGSFNDPQSTDVFTLGAGGQWTRSSETGAFMVQYLERDTAYFRAEFTADREELFVRIGSTTPSRVVAETRVTASAPTGSSWADWTWEWPSVSPTGDWVLYNWIHDTSCEEIYTVFAAPLRGGGSPVEALKSSMNWCGAGDYPVGFTFFGPTAWRSDGRAFISPRQAMPGDPNALLDMSIRMFSLTGSTFSPMGAPTTIADRIPNGVFWESDGARFRTAEKPRNVPCEVTTRTVANPGTVIEAFSPCHRFPYVGAGLRTASGPSGEDDRSARRLPPWATVHTSLRGIQFNSR